MFIFWYFDFSTIKLCDYWILRTAKVPTQVSCDGRYHFCGLWTFAYLCKRERCQLCILLHPGKAWSEIRVNTPLQVQLAILTLTVRPSRHHKFYLKDRSRELMPISFSIKNNCYRKQQPQHRMHYFRITNFSSFNYNNNCCALNLNLRIY